MNYDDLPIDFDFIEETIECLELGCYVGFPSNCEDLPDEDVFS